LAEWSDETTSSGQPWIHSPWQDADDLLARLQNYGDVCSYLEVFELDASNWYRHRRAHRLLPTCLLRRCPSGGTVGTSGRKITKLSSWKIRISIQSSNDRFEDQWSLGGAGQSGTWQSWGETGMSLLPATRALKCDEFRSHFAGFSAFLRS